MSVKVFPILERLRYLVPFHQVHETISWLAEQATESGTRCAVLHDDYEKFGVWPGTNKSVYGEGWLESFFQALTENKSWLRSVTYSDYMDANKALGRTYITCASYDEMMTWALPTGMQRELVNAREQLRQTPTLQQNCARFMRGGFWLFLAKYESRTTFRNVCCGPVTGWTGCAPDCRKRNVLKRRKDCCTRANAIAPIGTASSGLYLNHLRTALYENIIGADRVMDEIERETLRFPGVK